MNLSEHLIGPLDWKVRCKRTTTTQQTTTIQPFSWKCGCFLGMRSAFGESQRRSDTRQAGPSSLNATRCTYIQHVHTWARCQAWHWYLLSRLCIEEWGTVPVTSAGRQAGGRTRPSFSADSENMWRFTDTQPCQRSRRRTFLLYVNSDGTFMLCSAEVKFESALWVPKALFATGVSHLCGGWQQPLKPPPDVSVLSCRHSWRQRRSSYLQAAARLCSTRPKAEEKD